LLAKRQEAVQAAAEQAGSGVQTPEAAKAGA
jgi:hypothetical protein